MTDELILLNFTLL